MQSPSLGRATRENFQSTLAARVSLPHFWNWDSQTRRSALILLTEIALAAFSYALALCLLADGRSWHWIAAALRLTLSWLIALRVGASLIGRLYRRSLHYASMLDLVSMTEAISAGSILFGFLVEWRFSQIGIPVGVFLVDWAFLHLLWGGLHFGNRVFTTRQSANRKTGRRVVIVGAGAAGMTLLKELALDSASACRPVAVVDDDSAKWGRTRYEVPIVGGIETSPARSYRGAQMPRRFSFAFPVPRNLRCEAFWMRAASPTSRCERCHLSPKWPMEAILKKYRPGIYAAPASRSCCSERKCELT